MSRVIVITSGKGGVGKTTITANLGISLARIGASVVMLDADIGLNNLDVVMGIENKVVYDLVDVIQGKCRVGQALVQNPVIENLFVLPSSRYIEKSQITQEQMKKVVEKLKENFDFVLIDCPAGIEYGFSLATSTATEAIVVVTPHISAVRDADKVFSILTEKKLTSVYAVVNRIRGDMVARREMLSAMEIEKLLGTKLLGVIPESDEISMYSSVLAFRGNENSLGEQAINILGRNVYNEKFEIFDYISKYKGIIGTIRRNIKRRA